jgi:peptidyl-prolyl cis-trans isomerase D
MAVIGKIRKHSGLLVIVIGVALAAFVLGDFFKSSPQRSNNVGEINGEQITYQEFSREVDNQINIEKQNKQKDNLTEKEAYGIRHRTWSQIVYDIVMGDEIDNLGLDVSPEELFELVQGNNPHKFILQYFTDPTTGQFNRQRVLQYLQNLDQVGPEAVNQWVSFEQAIKKDQLQEKYNALVRKSFFVPEPFSEKIYQEKETEAITRLIGKKFFDVPDSLVSFTDKDLETYYNDHKYSYEQDEFVSFDYVVFEIRPSQEDHNQVKKEVDMLYGELQDIEGIALFVNAASDNRYDSSWFAAGQLPVMIDSSMMNGEIGTCVEPYIEDGAYHMARLVDVANRPDSMRASHILITYQGAYNADQSVTRTKDEAQRLADSLYNVLKRSPKKLDVFVGDFSEDPSAKQNNGDLGWFADQGMIYAFNEAVINGKINEFKMVETPFGFHVIKVLDKKDLSKKVRVAIIDVSIDPSNETEQQIYTNASVFAGENMLVEDFETSIADQGMAKRTAPNVAKMTNNVPGIENPRTVIRWAFDKNTNIGDVSPVFDLQDRYMVAVLTDRTEKGFKSMEDVRDNLERFVIREKKAEYLEEQLGKLDGNIYQMAKELGVSVDTVSVAFGSANVQGYGREAGVVGSIFALEPGVLSGPIAGNTGVYRVIVDNVMKAPGTDNYITYITPTINNFNRRVDNNYIYRALEDQAEIEDNRILFY